VGNKHPRKKYTPFLFTWTLSIATVAHQSVMQIVQSQRFNLQTFAVSWMLYQMSQNISAKDGLTWSDVLHVVND
jgi:hypothetical protein